MVASLRQDKRPVFDKVLDLLVAMLCCECRGRSRNLSSLFSATMCFFGCHTEGVGGVYMSRGLHGPEATYIGGNYTCWERHW